MGIEYGVVWFAVLCAIVVAILIAAAYIESKHDRHDDW